jgi:hypothetical protein
LREGRGRNRPTVPATGPAALQAAAGNAAVGALIAGAQAKLEVGSSNDPLEREADAVAEETVRALRSGVVTGAAAAAAAEGPPRIQRAGGATGGSGGRARLDPGAEAAIETSRAGGSPLPGPVRGRMEGAFGEDFSGVRIHQGDTAAVLNRSMGATAFTTGSDIFLGAGASVADDDLLAHELTHVVQQRGGSSDLAQRKTATSHDTSSSYDGTTSTTTTKDSAKAGAFGSSESSTDTFNGRTRETSETKAEGIAGAEAACEVLSRTSPGEIQAAIDLMARAGAFGEASRKAAIQRGAVSAGYDVGASGGAGASVAAKGSVTLSANLFDALHIVADAVAKVGVEGSVHARADAALGPLAASIGAQLTAFAGAMASCKADVSIGITHIHAVGEAKAFAGAKSEGSADVKIKLGDAEATAAIEGAAMAGASAEAKGTFKIDLTGVEISGKAEAFAGVKAEVSGKAALTHKGRTVIAAKGTVGVSAGIGGKAEAAFGFRAGKLTIKGDLAATLGIGGEVGAELEIDFYALALMIEDLIVSAFLNQKEAINRSSPAVERVPIIDPTLAVKKRKEGYETYLRDFMAYNAKKEKQGESGIKRQRVQEILDNRWHANKENFHFLEFDEGIMQAAKDAFGPKLKEIGVQAGQLRYFEVTRTAEQEAHLKKERMKKGMKF